MYSQRLSQVPQHVTHSTKLQEFGGLSCAYLGNGEQLCLLFTGAHIGRGATRTWTVPVE